MCQTAGTRIFWKKYINSDVEEEIHQLRWNSHSRRRVQIDIQWSIGFHIQF